MTQVLWLVYLPAEHPGEEIVNGVKYVLFNGVSTLTALQAQAAAVVACNAAYALNEGALNDGSNDQFAPGYFATATVVNIGDLSGGPLNANNDAYVLDPVGGPIAATA